MDRLLFPKGEQRQFLARNRLKLYKTGIDIAKICNVHSRTLFDWEREKFNMSYESAVKLEKLTKIPIPKTANFLPEFWNLSDAGRLGAKTSLRLYGNPGTPEGRSKGGRNACEFFRLNPDIAKKTGFSLRKKIKYPARCAELAELIGVILGDGGMPGNHQLAISFNSKTDKEYSVFLGKILRKLFSIGHHIHPRKGCNCADIVVNSSNLIDFLLKQGLVAGNKVKNQVDIPYWIHNKVAYEKACVRGLVDTDGSFYRHKYNSNGKKYTYLKLCVTSRSKPLLNSVLEILKKLNFEAFLHGDQVFVYSRQGIRKYFEEIGSHNPKHSNKIRKFLAN